MKATTFHQMSLIVLLISNLATCSGETITSIFTSTSTSTTIPIKDTATEPLAIPNIVPTSQPDCIAIAKQLPDNFQITGKVVLSGALFDSPSLLLDLGRNERISLPLEDGESILSWMFSVSPDRAMLAYGGARTNQWGKAISSQIHLITTDGNEYKVVPMDQDWINFVWLNDTQLLIERLIPEGKFTSSPILLNLTTGQTQELAVADPELMYFDQIEWGSFSLSRTAYNRDITKVAYPVFGKSHPIRLVDLQTRKKLADIPTTDYGKEPTWSPDGKRLAFISDISSITEGETHDEIFLIGGNNQLTRATYLSTKYPDFVLITSLAWSPDGQSLAFWLGTDKNAGSRDLRLAILDTSNGDVLEYCDPGSLVSFSEPIWSPDGKYLMIGLSNDNNIHDGLHSIVLIINSLTGEVFKIAEDYQPMGWLK